MSHARNLVGELIDLDKARGLKVEIIIAVRDQVGAFTQRNQRRHQALNIEESNNAGQRDRNGHKKDKQVAYIIDRSLDDMHVEANPDNPI